MPAYATGVGVLLAVLAVLLVLPRTPRLLPQARREAAARHVPGEGPAPTRALRLAATAGGALAVLLVVPGATGAAFAAAVAGVLWWRSRSWESAAVRRHRLRLEAELPHVVDLMTAALSAGAAPTTALSLVASSVDQPMADELRGWTTRLDLGADPAGAWRSMAGHPQLARLGLALLRSADSGAPVAESLRRLSEDLRDRRHADVEERVRQVEVRAAVPLGVCLLPSFVLVGVVPLVAGSVGGLLAR